MPNHNHKKTGKSAHANKQRAKEREEMNAKIEEITKSYEDQMGFLEIRSKELTEEIAKTKKDMIKKNEDIAEKLSKSRAKVDELQTEQIKIMNEKDEMVKAMEYAHEKTEKIWWEHQKTIDNLQKQGANMLKDLVKKDKIIKEQNQIIKATKREMGYSVSDTESESESESEEEENKCLLCGNEWDCPYGHNGRPLVEGQVCDKCNAEKVIPYRIKVYGNKPTDVNESDVDKLKKLLSEMGINVENKKIKVVVAK